MPSLATNGTEHHARAPHTVPCTSSNMPTTLTAAVLLTADCPILDPLVTIGDDGTILSIGTGPGDPNGSILAPASFDIHIHGAANHDVMEANPDSLDAIGRFLAARGVGHFLATTVTAPLDPTLRALEGLATLIESATGPHPDTEQREAEEPASPSAVPVGIHLEGPFISHAKRGVHPPAEIREPSIELFSQFWQASRGHIRLLTLAPEVPGALELARYATSLGVRVSLGHSDATTEEARAGIVAGATSATHTFNAMRRLDHREPGIAAVVLDSDQLFAELICDGIHVAPEFVRLWLRCKGPDRAILVTDGMSATGMPEGEYDLGGLAVAVANGRALLASDLKRGVETLAGSVLTLDQAIANVRSFTGCTLEQALGMVTRNPARMLGLDHLADVQVGRPANLVLYSARGELRQVILNGRTVPL
jgi:N-acetylglucosamine-6-phosphate deacetylase